MSNELKYYYENKNELTEEKREQLKRYNKLYYEQTKKFLSKPVKKVKKEKPDRPSLLGGEKIVYFS